MLPVGINAKYLGAGSAFVFVQGSVLRSGYHWGAFLTSKIRACSRGVTILPGREKQFHAVQYQAPKFFLYLTLHLTTLNLKPASCHLLLMKMPDAVCAQQSHFGLENLIKALWNWWTGQLCTGWEKYPVSHLNWPTGTWSQCNDVCGIASFLGEQSAVSFCALNKQTLCGNWS